MTGVAAHPRRGGRAGARKTPGLVLADIQLADGCSRHRCGEGHSGAFSVPVIFITAFPERLLTGERPEPTFLITKPFQRRDGEGGDQPGAVLRRCDRSSSVIAEHNSSRRVGRGNCDFVTRA